MCGDPVMAVAIGMQVSTASRSRAYGLLLILEAGARTLLLGWSARADIFTAWDPRHHIRFSPKSPSLQSSLESMLRALSQGFGFHKKKNDEITVSFLPEFLMAYVEGQEQFHRIKSDGILSLIQEAAEKVSREEGQSSIDPTMHQHGGPIANEGELEGAASRDVELVRRTIRQNSFPRQVLSAYSHTCCMCGMQLGFVEAAHIVPLGSLYNFSTRNGIALCPNHYKAFDASILGVSDNFAINRQSRPVGRAK
jgi:putative restriction endonuclease